MTMVKYWCHDDDDDAREKVISWKLPFFSRKLLSSLLIIFRKYIYIKKKSQNECIEASSTF